MRSKRRAHPRAGGENQQRRRQQQPGGGSSPRGRGKRDQITRALSADGLIPARAGKTLTSKTAMNRPWAHPRAGGENHLLTANQDGATGSSPRGRGKHREIKQQCQPIGLIPARAGKTRPRHQAPRQMWAHPRAGGENWPGGERENAEVGSSPRGRGKPDRVAHLPHSVGLIPARAGKTR